MNQVLNGIGASMGGVYNCAFSGPAHPVPDQCIIHHGNSQGFSIVDNIFEGLSAPGDIAILVENTNYFTEHLNIVGDQLLWNTSGVSFKKHCQSNVNCTNSFEHDVLDYYCADAYFKIGSCLSADNGAAVQYENLNLRFNIDGASGSAAVSVDGKSGFYQNTGNISGENDTGAIGYLLNVAAGGYADWTNVNTFCAACTDQSGDRIGYNGRFFDIPLSATGAFGNMPVNTFVNALDSATEPGSFYSIRCQNLTGGACPGTPPVVSIRNGRMNIGSVACPATIRSNETELSGDFYPGSFLPIVITTAAISCKAPTFTVTVHLRED
jgi:hypothetical protein